MSKLVKSLLAGLQTPSLEERPVETPVEEEPAAPVVEEEVVSEPAAPVSEEPAAAEEPTPAEPAAVEPLEVEEVAVDEEPMDAQADEDAVEGAEEVIDSVTDARDYDDACDELGDTEDGLGEARDVLQVMNEQGGVTQESLAFLNIALENYTRGMGLEPLALNVSVESFEGEDAPHRQIVSLEALDDLLDRISKGKVVLNDQRTQAHARAAESLKRLAPANALSFEDGESPVYDLADGDALASAQNVDTRRKADEQIEVLTDAQDSGEQILDLIEEQNERGGLSTEALIAAAVALESITKPLGLPEINLGVALEGLAFDAHTVVSTEGVGEALAKIGNAIKNKAKTIAMTVKSGLGMLSGELPKLIKSYEEFNGKLANVQGETSGKIAAGNTVKRLHAGGKWPEAFVPYFAEYSVFTSKMTEQFPKAALQDFAANLSACETMHYDSVEQVKEEAAKIAAGWKDPRSVLSAEELKLEIPGRGLFFGVREGHEKEGKYAGDVEALKKLEDFSKQNALNGLWVRHKESAPDVKEIDALKVADIKKGVEIALKTLKGINLAHLKTGDIAFRKWWDSVDMIQLKIRKASDVTKQVKPELAVLEEARFYSMLMAMDFGWAAAKDYVAAAMSFLAYCQRSLATAGKASAEAFDAPAGSEEPVAEEPAAPAEGEEPATTPEGQEEESAATDPSNQPDEDGGAVSEEALTVSTEADVKKLKSGTKVSYSHGHGKIVKVFTGPFKYAGKEHHASKDEPKFEVKNAKGHLSIHKASALTLV